MARLHDLVVDSAHPAAAARFWAAALDDYAIAPYDEAELARLRELEIAGPEDDPTVLLEPRNSGPRFWFRLVPEPENGTNRLHLDLLATDIEAETRRLTELGATVVARHDKNTVLTDPEGNEFCVFKG